MQHGPSAAIIGYGETHFAKFKHASGRTNYTEQCRAAAAAIRDAGISPRSIDGLVAIPPLDQTGSWTMDLAEYLQLQPKFLDNVYPGGAAGNAAILYSAAAINAGLCENVLLVGGSVMSDTRGALEYALGGFIPFERDFNKIYGATADNSAYALIKQRYKHEFGVGEEAFAKVTVNARFHASKFPNALLRDRITCEEVTASRIICDPLRLFEIVMPCAGAAALVMTSTDRARDARHPPVYLLGGGQSIDRGMRSPAYGRNRSLTDSPVKDAARRAFESSGLTIDDMHFAQLYDCYTVTVIISLEDIGCCKKGEGAAFVLDNDLTFKGDLPVNTDGGQLGRGQPYGACHFMAAIEAARQLMGRAGELQVADAKFGLANGNGGSMANECTLIFGSEIP